MQGKTIFMHLPFVTNDNFKLFKLTGFPRVAKDGNYFVPAIKKEIVGIGRNNFYFEMNDLKNCHKIKESSLFVCKKTHIFKSLEMPSCTVGLLTNSSSDCSWTQIQLENGFFVGQNETYWFLLLDKITPIHIKCLNHETFKEVVGLTLIRKTCIVSSKLFNLQTDKTIQFSENLEIPFFVKGIEIKALETPIRSNPFLSDLHKTMKKLNKTTKLSVEDIMVDFNRSWIVLNTHMGVSASIALLFLIIGAIVIFKIRKREEVSRSQVMELIELLEKRQTRNN